MVQIRVYREGSLLGEVDLAQTQVEIGDQPGDHVRLDEFEIGASPGFGGSLRQESGRWHFHPRPKGGGDTTPVAIENGGCLPVGCGNLELLFPEPGSEIDLDSLPEDHTEPVELGHLSRAPGSSGARLRLLGDLVTRFGAGGSSEALLEEALDVAFQLVECERGIAALLGEENKLRVVAVRNMDSEDPRSHLSRRVLDMVLGDGREVFTGNAPVDIPTVSVDLRSIRAICALPLRVGGRVAGVLYVDRGRTGAPFGSEDLAFLQLLAMLVGHALEEDRRFREAEQERLRLAGQLANKESEEERDLAWTSPAMQRVRSEAGRLLKAFQGRSLPVLITGESGTGKEVLARWLHNHLDGNAGPFVAVNCAAIPADLAESELFGIEQGVATGVVRRVGRFQQACGGTLFLDEVGEMPLPIQAKLLRALETRRIVRVGGHQEISVDVRIISATNVSLAEACRRGDFREDLYWRLNGVELRMPPLRDRREDIPKLCAVFARRFAEDFGLPTPRFDSGAMARLIAHRWPGNVRELKQRMGAMTALAIDGRVREEDLPVDIRMDAGVGAARLDAAESNGHAHGATAAEADPLEGPILTIRETEELLIQRALHAAQGDLNIAADMLGIHKKTLRRKIGA